MIAPLNKSPYRNLAVNQKAVMQPVFRFRRWLEEQKQLIPDGGLASIADIETSLPPLRGLTSSVSNYCEQLEQVEEQLLDFYNSGNHR
ncbi:hypothetical protein BGZ76_008724, partial [Entomortierella beljakovae]